MSEAELTQCVDLFEAIEEEFEVAGCGSEFKAALRCGLRNSTCEAGGLTLEEEDCEVDGEALETCEEER